MSNAEARIQASIVEWARAAAPQAVVFAVIQDGLCTKREGAKAKWMGRLAGVPDVVVVVHGRVHFMEVKAPGGVASDDQKSVMSRLVEAGARCAIVRSVESARRVFEAWGIHVVEEAERASA